MKLDGIYVCMSKNYELGKNRLTVQFNIVNTLWSEVFK